MRTVTREELPFLLTDGWPREYLPVIARLGVRCFHKVASGHVNTFLYNTHTYTAQVSVFR